jgi:hypothetical protein
MALPSAIQTSSITVIEMRVASRKASEFEIGWAPVTKTIWVMICGPAIIVMASGRIWPALLMRLPRVAGGELYATAFALIASNSACVIAPLSRSAFAFSISAAAPPAVWRT